jgi:branched-chain amino acid transport system substrate-binding protein
MRPRLPRIARGVVLGLALTATMTATMTGAACAKDFKIGGTMQGYGAKFYPPGQRMAGQNERSIAGVMQYVDGKTNVVWPKQLRTVEPMLPLPPGHAYAP